MNTENASTLLGETAEVSMVTLVVEESQTFGSPGAKMLVGREKVFGSLGSPTIDRYAVEAGRASLDDGYVRVCRVTFGGETRQECRLLVEPYMPPPELLVLGGGHIALPLAMLGNMLDYRVTVVDDRPEFASPKRFPGPSRVICGDFIEVLRGLKVGRWTSIVIVTRGHQHDYRCLVETLGRNAFYIGMIGSKRKVRLLREQLLKEGFTAEQIDSVHMPIGLDIGAQTPEEIAISIAAELVKVRRGGSAHSIAGIAANTAPVSRGEIRTRDDMEVTLEALAMARSGKRAALATIIEAGGSTPRKAGARMAVLENGRSLGTVGGGGAESAVMEAALQVIAEDRPRLLRISLDAGDAAAAGMICGGNMEVYIEPVTMMDKFLRELKAHE